jgi:hypothetical protein
VLHFVPSVSRPYPDGPPPGHTGGFREPTCRACHADNALNAPGGSLALSGLPAVYQPGTSYRLTVTLRRADLRRAGFQLAARFDSGVSAGSLTPLDSSVAVTWSPAGVSYAHQTRTGSTRRETAAWTLEWRAPDSAGTTVAFHVAANAANDDASEFGDFIYTHVAHASATPRRANQGRHTEPDVPVRADVALTRLGVGSGSSSVSAKGSTDTPP